MKTIERKLYKIDAEGQAAGRIATRIATILRGKHKADFQPSVDSGDIVEVANIGKLKFTGKKLEQKKYYHYSGYPGGMRSKTMSEVAEKDPGEILRRAVKQMLPATRLRDGMMKRLIIR